MPLYPFECSGCGYKVLELRSVVKMDRPLDCEVCGRPMTRKMTAPETIKIQGGGTRNHNKIKMWSLEDRMGAKYGDNP